MAEQTPTTGIIDPQTGQPVPNSGPSGGPPGAAAGTQARDVATRGTAGTEDGPKDLIGDDEPSKAADATDAAKDKASDAADAAKDKASDVADQAQAKAQDAAGQAKEQIHAQLDQRSTQAGERATATAGDLRSISEHLKEQGNDAPAKLADNAALQIEKAGSYLQRTDGQSLLSDVEEFARRNPWAAALGGLAIGFAASRALKASSAERSSSRGSGASAQSLPSAPPTPVADAASAATTPVPGYEPPSGSATNPLGT